MAKRKYISVGRLEKEMECAIAAQPEKQKKRKIYPSFYLDASALKIPDDKIGKECEAEVKLMIKSKRIAHREESREFDYELEVRAIRFPEKKKDPRNIQQQLEDDLNAANKET